MLFLGLGTGLGAAVIMDGVLEPLELAVHLKKRTVEHYVGNRGLKATGAKEMATPCPRDRGAFGYGPQTQ